MRKIILAVIGLAMSFTLFAQENKDGKMQNDILYLNNGVMLRKGSTLRLNGPLGEDSHFKYIFHAPDNLFDDMKGTTDKAAEPYYASKDVTVRKIRYVGDKKEGSDGKWMVRLRTGDKTDFLCDIVLALNSGEISPMQSEYIAPSQVNYEQKPPQPTEIAKEPVKVEGTSIGVADEILKLKKLMDEGVITKEEFEAQKKKLLE